MVRERGKRWHGGGAVELDSGQRGWGWGLEWKGEEASLPGNQSGARALVTSSQATCI